MAGGENIFPEMSKSSLAKGRILENDQEVIARNPDIILASWCGKMFKKDKMLARSGWEQIEAVKHDDIYEIDSSIILQPGPAAVGEGLILLHDIFKRWVEKRSNI
jgi:iron complex transport system substrate-binding protein